MGGPPFSTTPWRGIGGTNPPPVVLRTVRTVITLEKHCDVNVSGLGREGEIGGSGVAGLGRRPPRVAGVRGVFTHGSARHPIRGTSSS